MAKNTFQRGGLDMIDFRLFDESLKISWLRRIQESQSPWVKIAKKAYPFLFNIFKFGDKYVEIIQKNIVNEFWNNVVTYYYSFYSNYNLKSTNELETVSFLYNSKIKVDKKPIQNKVLEKQVFT